LRNFHGIGWRFCQRL